MPWFNGYRSRIFYTGNGSAQNLSIFFPYLDPTHVYVYVDDALQESDTWSWLNESTLTITAAAATSIEIRRSTGLDPLVTFTNASLLNEDDQNTAALQAIYLIEEGADVGYIMAQEITNVQTQTDTAVVFVIDAGGVAITAGVRGCLQIPFNGTIVAAQILTDQVGSVIVDIWKDTYANYPPTDADSITGAAPLTIADNDQVNAVLTGWDTAIISGDILIYNIDSISAITRMTITLTVRKN